MFQLIIRNVASSIKGTYDNPQIQNVPRMQVVRGGGEDRGTYMEQMRGMEEQMARRVGGDIQAPGGKRRGPRGEAVEMDRDICNIAFLTCVFLVLHHFEKRAFSSDLTYVALSFP
ncbi:hypothetical protein BDZ91DRAFT_728756 [Kalaharituber pfeilii]|nr:hypothetical protein BDZ91DRAFT_728756 [Kalaharituber pfeilii]